MCLTPGEELVRQQMHLFISYNLLGQQDANNQLGMMKRPQTVRMGRSLHWWSEKIMYIKVLHKPESTI